MSGRTSTDTWLAQSDALARAVAGEPRPVPVTRWAAWCCTGTTALCFTAVVAPVLCLLAVCVLVAVVCGGVVCTWLDDRATRRTLPRSATRQVRS